MVDNTDSVNDPSGPAETAVQLGDLRGGIHLHASRSSFQPPHQLPLLPSGFVNRETNLRELDALIAEIFTDDGGHTMSAIISAVGGAPGVGKTALAVRWAHQVRHQFPDGNLYVDMQGYGPGPALTPERALDAFLRAMGVPSESLPEDLGAQAALFRSLLDGQRVLVLIDNASSSAQVRQLLPASRQCCVVVTSRSTLPGLVAREGAVRVTLDTLSPEESVRLLSEVVGDARIDAERSSAVRVAELCGHLPLALRVVAERAAIRPQLSMTELVDELVGEQNRLDALASAEDELSDVRAVFSWSYQALTPDLRQAFRRLGLHAGSEIGVEAAAALIGIGVASARRRLRSLADSHLLQEITPNRFRLHDLLRSYSVECALADETQEERTQAVRRLLGWYLLTADVARQAVLPYSPAVPLIPAGYIDVAEGFASTPEAMRWFDTERLNLLAALRQATELGQYDIGWKLPMVTTGFFELRSYLSEWEDNHRIGLQAALALGDSLGEATNRLMLGDVAWRLSRFDEATETYERAASLARQLSVGWLEGFAVRGLGLVHEARENFDAASELFESALSVFRSSDFRRGEGMALLSLGKCARAVGDLPRAIAYGAEAVGTFEDIQDTWTVGWGRLALAESLTDLDRGAEAIDQLRQAVEVFRQFGDQRSEALGLVPLGELLQHSGDLAGAQDCWSRAADLQEALRDPRSMETRARLTDLNLDR